MRNRTILEVIELLWNAEFLINSVEVIILMKLIDFMQIY